MDDNLFYVIYAITCMTWLIIGLSVETLIREINNIKDMLKEIREERF